MLRVSEVESKFIGIPLVFVLCQKAYTTLCCGTLVKRTDNNEVRLSKWIQAGL